MDFGRLVGLVSEGLIGRWVCACVRGWVWPRSSQPLCNLQANGGLVYRELPLFTNIEMWGGEGGLARTTDTHIH